jgi:hypothetical protein
MSNNNMLSNLNPDVALKPFAKAIGNPYPKIVADCKSMLGKVEKDIVTTQGEWKASASFVLSSKEGRKVQLPLNNPAAQLLCFGMRFNELCKSAGNEVEATIPKNCTAWIEEHSRNFKQGEKPAEVVA